MKRAPRFFCAAVAAVIASGCLPELTLPPMENPDCGDYLGSFKGNATGAVTATLSGCAYFQVDTLSGSFGMVLTNGGPDAKNPMIRLLRSSFPPPPQASPGGFPAGESTFSVGSERGNIFGHIILGPKVFTLTTGILVRQTSAEDVLYKEYSLHGRIDMTGQASDGTTLTVTGDFIGRCVESNRADPGIDDGPSAPRNSCTRPEGAAFRFP